MPYLIAALAAPAAGPILYRLLHGHARAARVVDALVFAAVPMLVGWQVLSTAWLERSVLVVLAAGAGLLVPDGMERASRVLARHTDDLVILVGLSGLYLHALLEGAALTGSVEASPAFALAVVLHRAPVGLIIWWLIRPRHGTGRAALGVASLSLATFVGFVVGWEILGDAHGPGLELFQAFVGGSLVHVVFHQGRHDHDHGPEGHAHAGHDHHGHQPGHPHEHEHDHEHDHDHEHHPDRG